MQKTVLFIIFLICGVRLYSQQPNYLYIEAEKGQLFYVKIKDKVHSSSPGGYIIIPGLTEDSYTLSIGFPKNAFPEQRFTIKLNKNDRGYQLKNLSEKGWGLFDFQTMALIANDNAQNTGDTNQVKKTDAFSTLLSKVVNDPSVLIENKKPAAPVPAKKVQDTTNPEVVATAPIKTGTDTVKAVAATVKEETQTTGIHQLFEHKLEQIYEAVYVDGANDTIRISYPIDKSIMTAPPATPLTDNVAPEKPVVKITNSDCSNFANDQDVDKLRVKLLKEGEMDNKLAAAKKYFRTKCFTVKQVRALAELFTQDENKYQLFDIAYPFISDTENFYQLEDNLKDEYYKNRFKAMIKK